MQAGETTCACPECGVVCEGLFDGCPDVWARGLPVALNLSPAAPLRMRGLNAGPATQVEEPSPLPPPPSALSPARPPPVDPQPPDPQPSRSSPFQAAPPPPRPSALANGFSGGSVPPPRPTRTAAPPPPPQAPPLQQQIGAETRTDVLRWFEDAFDDLRHELHAVVSTVTGQQAMLAELLDTRDAEMRVAMVAESLPELAGEAAAKALADQTVGLAELVEGRLEDFRVAAESSDLSAVAAMDGMRELLQRIETSAEMQIGAANEEGRARLDALKTSVARQLKPVAAAVAEVSARLDEAQEREAARHRALRASVTKQVQPLTVALVAAIERSDAQMAEFRGRLDSVAVPPRSPKPAEVLPTAKVTKAAGAVKVAKVVKAKKISRSMPGTDATADPRPRRRTVEVMPTLQRDAGKPSPIRSE